MKVSTPRPPGYNRGMIDDLLMSLVWPLQIILLICLIIGSFWWRDVPVRERLKKRMQELRALRENDESQKEEPPVNPSTNSG